MLYDVIVVGLGPAGATAAYELASKGLKVLAFDKEKFPRYKPCGGCLSEKVVKILPFDFKAVVEDTIYGTKFTYKSKREVSIISQEPVGYNVNRDRFDDFLKKKAEEAGADSKEERVIDIEEYTDYVSIKTSKGLYKARILIGADGANSLVAKKALGLSSKKHVVAMEAEIPCTEERIKSIRKSILLDFGCIPHGYGWIFPKAKNLSVGIAGVSDKLKGSIKDYFKDFVKKKKILEGLNIDNIYGWIIPYFYDSGQKIANRRVLAVGDAAHLVDPFLGEGIYYAIRSGQLAAKVITEKIGTTDIDVTPYNEMIVKELYPELIAAAKLGNLIYNYPRMWYRILQGHPSIIEKYYAVIRGKDTYDGFYTDLISRIKARPWRLVTKWIKGRKKVGV